MQKKKLAVLALAATALLALPSAASAHDHFAFRPRHFWFAPRPHFFAPAFVPAPVVYAPPVYVAPPCAPRAYVAAPLPFPAPRFFLRTPHVAVGIGF
jgi:hypothetical protein